MINIEYLYEIFQTNQEFLYMIKVILFVFLLSVLMAVIIRKDKSQLSSKKKSIMDALNFKEVSEKKLEGVHNQKKIEISFNTTSLSLRVKTSFNDLSRLKLRSKLYLSFRRRLNTIKWRGFERSIMTIGKIDLPLSEKNKSDFEYLYNRGYFSSFCNKEQGPSLKIYPLKKVFFKEENGKIVFKLSWKISEDIESLNVVMDLVTELSKQMESGNLYKKRKRNTSSIGQKLELLLEFVKNTIMTLPDISQDTSAKNKVDIPEPFILIKLAETFGFEEVQHGRLKTIYRGKDIIASLVNYRSVRIVAYFSDLSMPKTTLLPGPYFSLTIKNLNTKISSFESVLKKKNDIDFRVRKENKNGLKRLFDKDYLRVYSSLTIWPPRKILGIKDKGVVSFILPKNILKDTDSLKIAMDVVIDVAKQMDEMKMGSAY